MGRLTLTEAAAFLQEAHARGEVAQPYSLAKLLVAVTGRLLKARILTSQKEGRPPQYYVTEEDLWRFAEENPLFALVEARAAELASQPLRKRPSKDAIEEGRIRREIEVFHEERALKREVGDVWT